MKQSRAKAKGGKPRKSLEKSCQKIKKKHESFLNINQPPHSGTYTTLFAHSFLYLPIPCIGSSRCTLNSQTCYT